VIKYECSLKSGDLECFVLEHVQHDRPEVSVIYSLKLFVFLSSTNINSSFLKYFFYLPDFEEGHRFA
jgi:hypothetical protein